VFFFAFWVLLCLVSWLNYEMKTLVEVQPNSRFVDFEKMRVKVFRQMHAFITLALHNTGIFLYRSVRLDVLNVIMQKIDLFLLTFGLNLKKTHIGLLFHIN